MKVISYILLIILAIMSLAAGGTKVARMPQEVDFFAAAGLSAAWLLPLGIVQIIGALGSLYPMSRSIGLLLVAAGFLASSVVIFMTGNAIFGAISLVPVVLAIFVRSHF